MGKHAKLKEKQKWSNEKIHLENARNLRGIYFIDPEDKEFKETIKNARKKLETSVAPAMPCKFLKNCGSDAPNKIKTKLACILEADESTRMRVVNSMPHYHQDHIAGKGENSLQHYRVLRPIGYCRFELNVWVWRSFFGLIRSPKTGLFLTFWKVNRRNFKRSSRLKKTRFLLKIVGKK